LPPLQSRNYIPHGQKSIPFEGIDKPSAEN